jgi:hypothetical protein
VAHKRFPVKKFHFMTLPRPVMDVCSSTPWNVGAHREHALMCENRERVLPGVFGHAGRDAGGPQAPIVSRKCHFASRQPLAGDKRSDFAKNNDM